MKVAYFDCQFGAAGDMLNAALLSAGLDQKAWLCELDKIALPAGSFLPRVSEVIRCGITCKRLEVLDSQGTGFDTLYMQDVDKLHPGAQAHSHSHEHSHDHGHTHSHADDHTQGHAHPGDHTQSSHQDRAGTHTYVRRGLSSVLQVIENSTIATEAKELASAIFKRLARAESRVHGVSPEDVHFHEVGAIDAIVDIVGFAIGYKLLGIEQAFCSGVPLGSGKGNTEHGLYPIPGPATLYLLQEAAALILPSGIKFECLTPTGAAILCEVVERWGVQPGISKIAAVGYGAGTKDTADWPNATRVVLGKQDDTESGIDSKFDPQKITVIEVNLDDLSPQVLAFTMDRLFEAGALDVSVTPQVMKKGRLGHLLTVLCQTDKRLALQEIVFAQTSTIGLRFYEASRAVARRHFQEVQLASGSVRIKVAADAAGNLINAQPEFEDCSKYAAEQKLPVKDVINQALSRFYQDNDRA